MRRLLAPFFFLALSPLWFLPDFSLAAGDGAQPGDHAQPAPVAPDHQGEVQMETGLAFPLGNLGAGFAHTQRGMGAGRGYHMGLRVRFYPARCLVMAPSFTYIEFGDYEGVASDDELFEIQASILRYGLDLLYLAPAGSGRLRPFVGLGLAVARNKYRETFPDAKTEYLAGVNSLAGSLVAGARSGDLDISFVYEINSFTTSQLSFNGEPLRYRWNSLLLRVSYTLPRL